MDFKEIFSKSIWILIPILIYIFEAFMKNLKKKTAPPAGNIPQGAEEPWHNVDYENIEDDNEEEFDDIVDNRVLHYDPELESMVVENPHRETRSEREAEEKERMGRIYNKKNHHQQKSSSMIGEMLKDGKSLKKAVILSEILTPKY